MHPSRPVEDALPEVAWRDPPSASPVLDFPEEVGQVLITPGVMGVSLVILRPLESMIQNADEVVGRIASARAVSHRKPPLLITTLAQPSGSA